MTGLVEWVKANPAAAATVSAACIALCGVVISAFVAFTTGRRSVYISSVTTERSKWIEKLRANIADLLGVCSAINLSMLHKTAPDPRRTAPVDAVAFERRHQADRLIALITLQLNPNDESGIDWNLIIHMKKLIRAAEQSDDSYRLEESKFIRHCQFLLKEEWEKVKSEARGPMKSFVTRQNEKARARKKAYLRFYQEELKPKL